MADGNNLLLAAKTEEQKQSLAQKRKARRIARPSLLELHVHQVGVLASIGENMQ